MLEHLYKILLILSLLLLSHDSIYDINPNIIVPILASMIIVEE